MSEITFDLGALRCALTFSGVLGSHGTVSSRFAEVRAFGPQKLPLSDPKGFGIRPVQQHQGRWASPIASPEVWYSMEIFSRESVISFALSFFGLESSLPLAFSFYVKADSACVGSESLAKRCLKRYQGDSRSVIFGKSFCLEANRVSRLHVIPLAGDESFWEADYLAAFELDPLEPRVSYSLRSLSERRIVQTYPKEEL